MSMPDFEGLSKHLLSRIRDILPDLVPGGKIEGAEYVAGDIHGSPGRSFKINMQSGLWSDFSQGQSGGDIISLYAAIHNIKQGEAAEQLSQRYNFGSIKSMGVPSMRHPVYGDPACSWAYRDRSGAILYYTARYNTPSGKEFMPWTWTGSKWVAKAYPEPRPLYGLETLSKPAVLVVEGEKAADAARQLLGSSYDVVTWSGGSKAFRKADWSSIHGKRVLIWPDADNPGVEAAQGIAKILAPHCSEVKIITPDPSRPKAWDAADALADGWTRDQVIEWARANVTVYNITVNQTNITVNPPVDADMDMPTDSMHATWERLGLVLSQQGYPICNEDNVARVFEMEPILGSKIWYDEFYNSVFIERSDGPHQIEEIDVYKLTLKLQRQYGMRRISDSTIWRSLLILADRVRRNEPRDWMESLVWDSVPRIDKFMHTHLGARDNDYVRCASKNFWISMVARIYEPGCIMRTMVILKAPQWAGKSTAFSIIGGKWYAEALESIQSNNFLQSLHGKMLIEFADMSGLDRAEINRIKQIISCRMDRFRAPYDRTPKDHQRRCVLVSTTNEGHFLRDDTGGSRFWPIETGKIDHNMIISDRDQLFAEAVHAFKNGAKWHIMPAEETSAIQESYRQSDEWEDIIAEYLSQNAVLITEITIAQLARDCLKISSDRLEKSVQMRIARNLTVIGWKKRQKMANGKNSNVWFKDTQSIEVVDW